jgi:threonine dehydrogenase-like Zn-dependent dehydrogenase
MKALALVPGTTDVSLRNYSEPKIEKPTQVKMKVLEVGVCGTDREEVKGGRATAPPESDHLVIGHEMLGVVTEKGSEVSTVKVGDFGVFSVRRGCGKCVACENNRSDMCYTAEYTERGIKGLNGYEAEYVVDEEQYVVKVPPSIRSIGVLTEPMSVAEKAIDEAVLIQAARLPEVAQHHWLQGKTALVAGLGAIGLLAGIALRLRGAEVIGMDIVDENTRRPSILKKIGGKYVNGKKTSILDFDDQFGQIDFIFEAAGVAEVGFNLIDALGINGIYVMTGLPHERRMISIGGGSLMSQMVLKNQIVLGSVNASPRHFALAIADLEKGMNKWGSVMEELITTRVPYSDFMKALEFRSVDDIKTVVEWEGHA